MTPNLSSSKSYQEWHDCKQTLYKKENRLEKTWESDDITSSVVGKEKIKTQHQYHPYPH